jgi:tRNA nucleotidyltransferase (CCA-adding enzyme)
LQELFPELYETLATPQREDYHPEGNVFEHTMQALDAAAQIEELPKESKEKLIVMLAALCHDLGKVTTTDDQLHAYGHEDEGKTIAKKMLKRLTDDIQIIKSVSLLVKHHMKPFAFIREGAKPKAYKRLAKKLAPYTNMQQLAYLARADSMGRNPEKGEPLSENPKEYYLFLEKIDQLEVRHKPEAPVLLGRHLLDTIKPGPEMGKILNQAYEIQLEEGIKDVEELKKRALNISFPRG